MTSEGQMECNNDLETKNCINYKQYTNNIT